LLTQGSSKLLSGYVNDLNTWESSLGAGIFRAGYQTGRAEPWLQPAAVCLQAVAGGGFALLAAIAFLCPECDVVLLSTGAIVITAGGTAAVMAAIDTIAAGISC
jgi:hypothetical protein